MMNELFLVSVRREAAQEAPGPFVAGLAGPSHSWRGVLAGGPPDAPEVDGFLGTGGRGVWWCCRICAWCPTILAWIIGEILRKNVRQVYTDSGQKIDELISA